jgi:hypothetical protein
MLPLQLSQLRDRFQQDVAAASTKPFSAFNADRFEGREIRVPWMNKLRTKEFLQSLGVRTAKTFAVLDSGGEITDRHLPDRCVIKPASGTNSTGVMVLRRDGDGFYDLMQRRYFDVSQIQSFQRFSHAKLAKERALESPQVLIEEAILDEGGADMIPYDYKVWVFNGRVAFIEQVDRNTSPKSAAWYVYDFHPIKVEDVAFPDLRRFGRRPHRLPRCQSEILRVASAASQALRTPYIRVDAYATPDGAVVGELTPGAGPLYYGAWRFQPWFDALLGRYWSAAARELQ